MRYKIVSDNDGHDYVIPANLDDEFYKWVDAEENDEVYDGYEDFNEFRMNTNNLTFTDPQGYK